MRAASTKQEREQIRLSTIARCRSAPRNSASSPAAARTSPTSSGRNARGADLVVLGGGDATLSAAADRGARTAVAADFAMAGKALYDSYTAVQVACERRLEEAWVRDRLLPTHRQPVLWHSWLYH